VDDPFYDLRLALMQFTFALNDPDLSPTEFMGQWTRVGIAAAEARETVRWRFAMALQSPAEFCVTPGGKRDAHGSFVRLPAPQDGLRCAFCGRPTCATPADPEGVQGLADKPRKIVHKRRPRS